MFSQASVCPRGGEMYTPLDSHPPCYFIRLDGIKYLNTQNLGEDSTFSLIQFFGRTRADWCQWLALG